MPRFLPFLIGAVLLVLAIQPNAAATEKPNVLLVFADDVGYSDLDCYGGEIETPHLNQLATEGIRFSEFHVNPMCVVTRTSLMTGHTHSQSGKALTKGNWKISSISDGPWRLYDIQNDPAESRDLAAGRHEVLAKMNDAWFQFARKHTKMPASWRASLKDYQEGWGYHRIRMIMPGYVRAVPPCHR